MNTQDQNAQNVAQEATKPQTRKTTAKATDKKQCALSVIQSELRAPKNLQNNYNSRNAFNYRNAESILAAVKPMLVEHNCSLILTDDIRHVGDFTFVEATAVFTDADGQVTTVKACAGIEPRKGMDLAQSFGSSSSYARKYALGGLFLLDDNKDPDSLDNSQNNQQQRSQNNGNWNNQQANNQNAGNWNNQQTNNAQYNQQARGQNNQKQSVTPPPPKATHLFDLDPSLHQEKFNNALVRIKNAVDANALNAAVEFFAGTIYANDISNSCSARADQLGILNNG